MDGKDSAKDISLCGDNIERFTYLEGRLTIANGDKEVIDMKRKRSGKIYDEIMERIGAIDLNGKFGMAKQKAETLVKPHLKWV